MVPRSPAVSLCPGQGYLEQMIVQLKQVNDTKLLRLFPEALCTPSSMWASQLLFDLLMLQAAQRSLHALERTQDQTKPVADNSQKKPPSTEQQPRVGRVI